jgi:hypothetical protein
MKIFTTLFALVGLIFLTSIVDIASAATPVPIMPPGIWHHICGACDIKEFNNVTIPLVSYFQRDMTPFYKCNTIGKEGRAALEGWLPEDKLEPLSFNKCRNFDCDFCAVWK